MESENLTTWMEQLQNPGQIVALGLLLLGLVLWLMGRKLAQPACATTGLATGGVLALIASQAIGDGGMLLVWLIAGCILGATLAWLLYRVWMGITCALVLALLAPMAVLCWQDATGVATESDDPATPEAQVEPLAMSQPIPAGEAAGQTTPSSRTNAPPSDPINQLQHHLRERYQVARGQLEEWWQQQSSARQRTILVSGIAAAGVGLIGGMAMPYLMASFTSALLGTVLVLFASHQLVTHWSSEPQRWLPERPMVYGLVLLAGTALGLLLQWSIFRGGKDK